MEKKGYGIAQYERNLPAGAVIDEVRYRAEGGQRVENVIGTVERRVPLGCEFRIKVEVVTWDGDGLCRMRCNDERLPEFDIELD